MRASHDESMPGLVAGLINLVWDYSGRLDAMGRAIDPCGKEGEMDDTCPHI